jgi:hypothetical protein
VNLSSQNPKGGEKYVGILIWRRLWRQQLCINRSIVRSPYHYWSLKSKLREEDALNLKEDLVVDFSN